MSAARRLCGAFGAPGARAALRETLAAVGALMSLASRVDPLLRGCITRDVAFEISTEDGVARHWLFDGASRRVSSHPGRLAHPDCALRFADAGGALRVLAGKPEAAHAAVVTGAMRIEGSAALALWFAGLVKRLTRPGRRRTRSRPLPQPYVAHDPAAEAARYITVEAPQRELDRSWEAAWRQRAKLAVVRVPSGEPPQAF